MWAAQSGSGRPGASCAIAPGGDTGADAHDRGPFKRGAQTAIFFSAYC
jgi:hypothetical protein